MKVEEGKYKINIRYETGDSFESHDEEQTLEISWNNLDMAKQNLQFIKEHYNMYKDIKNTWNKKEKEEIYEENKNKEWFVYEKILLVNDCKILEKNRHRYNKSELKYVPDDYYAQNCIKLKTDEENTFQLHCFWIGYFERLYGAKIIMNEDNDLEFDVN